MSGHMMTWPQLKTDRRAVTAVEHLNGDPAAIRCGVPEPLAEPVQQLLAFIGTGLVNVGIP
jgi:hypothetical protein